MHSDSEPGDLAPNSATGVPAAEEPTLPAFALPAVAAGFSRLDAHILVVDDEPINVRVIQKFLGAAGYHRVSYAESGQQALDFFARDMPDLVLLDVFLADVNGIEVLKRLRTFPGGKRLPVLILTASTDRDLERCALDLGAAGFLTKPIGHTELVAWLEKTLPGN